MSDDESSPIQFLENALRDAQEEHGMEKAYRQDIEKERDAAIHRAKTAEATIEQLQGLWVKLGAYENEPVYDEIDALLSETER